MPQRTSDSSIARDWALVRYSTAMSPQLSSGWAASIVRSRCTTASASAISSSQRVSEINSPSPRVGRNTLSIRSLLLAMSALAASRIVAVER